MSNNLNPTSKRIIIFWFGRAQIPFKEHQYDYFDKFISLWISFNYYFVSKLHDKACESACIQNKDDKIEYRKVEPSEADYLKVLIDTLKYKDIYLNLIGNSDDFVNKLELFKEFIQEMIIKWQIYVQKGVKRAMRRNLMTLTILNSSFLSHIKLDAIYFMEIKVHLLEEMLN